MPIAKRPVKKQFQQASDGLHAGVLADVEDLGVQINPFDGEQKHKVRLIYLVDELDSETGQPLQISQFCTLSLHEKAILYQVFKALTGSYPVEDQEIDDLIGAAGSAWTPCTWAT